MQNARENKTNPRLRLKRPRKTWRNEDALKALFFARSLVRSTLRRRFLWINILKVLLQVTETATRLANFFLSFRRLRKGSEIMCWLFVLPSRRISRTRNFFVAKINFFFYFFSLHSLRSDPTSQFDCLKFQERLKCEKLGKSCVNVARLFPSRARARYCAIAVFLLLLSTETVFIDFWLFFLPLSLNESSSLEADLIETNGN